MKKQRSVILIFFLVFFQAVSSNVGHPITPSFVTSLGIADYMFGIFFAIMSVGLMIGGILWGSLGEIKNKKYLIFAGLMIYGFGQFGFGYANHQAIMIIFRLISGLGASAAVTLFTAQIVEASDKKNRTRNLGFSAAFLTIGTSVGYYLGGQLGSNPYFVDLLGTNDMRIVFLIQALMNILLAFVVLATFDFKQKEKPKHRESIFTSFKYISSLKGTLIIFLVSLTLFSMGRINIEKYLDVYFNELGYLPDDIGTFNMVTGIVSLIASIILVPMIAKTKKMLPLITGLHLLAAIIIWFVFRANNFMLIIYTVYMLFVIIRTIYQPLEQNYIASQVTDGKYSMAMGVRQSFYSLGSVLGPLAGGFLYEIRPVVVFDTSAGLFLTSTVLLIIIQLLLKSERKNKIRDIRISSLKTDTNKKETEELESYTL